MTTAQTRPKTTYLPSMGGDAWFVRNTSAPAQGREAQQAQYFVAHNFTHGTTQGQSIESTQVRVAAKKILSELIPWIEGASQTLPAQGLDEVAYKAIPPKPLFKVQATYRFVGKLKPRQFPIDDE